jgi:surfeit locus 1 family protein
VSSGLRRGLFVPIVFALSAITVFVTLGTWQITRKAWKQELIQTLDQRLSGPEQALPPTDRWATLTQADDEFRRVKLRAEFFGREARVYTGGPGLREDVKSPGYYVFAPARLPDGGIVVVNRGYVSKPQPNAQTPPVSHPEGPVEITGVLRWPAKPGWYDTEHSATGDLWFVRNPLAMAAQNQWGAVAPFYVDQEAPVPVGGVPRPGKLKVTLRNDHLQYALTWYSLAIVVAALSVFWLRNRRRETSAG